MKEIIRRLRQAYYRRSLDKMEWKLMDEKFILAALKPVMDQAFDTLDAMQEHIAKGNKITGKLGKNTNYQLKGDTYVKAGADIPKKNVQADEILSAIADVGLEEVRRIAAEARNAKEDEVFLDDEDENEIYGTLFKGVLFCEQHRILRRLPDSNHVKLVSLAGGTEAKGTIAQWLSEGEKTCAEEKGEDSVKRIFQGYYTLYRNRCMNNKPMKTPVPFRVWKVQEQNRFVDMVMNVACADPYQRPDKEPAILPMPINGADRMYMFDTSELHRRIEEVGPQSFEDLAPLHQKFISYLHEDEVWIFCYFITNVWNRVPEMTSNRQMLVLVGAPSTGKTKLLMNLCRFFKNMVAPNFIQTSLKLSEDDTHCTGPLGLCPPAGIFYTEFQEDWEKNFFCVSGIAQMLPGQGEEIKVNPKGINQITYACWAKYIMATNPSVIQKFPAIGRQMIERVAVLELKVDSDTLNRSATEVNIALAETAFDYDSAFGVSPNGAEKTDIAYLKLLRFCLDETKKRGIPSDATIKTRKSTEMVNRALGVTKDDLRAIEERFIECIAAHKGDRSKKWLKETSGKHAHVFDSRDFLCITKAITNWAHADKCTEARNKQRVSHESAATEVIEAERTSGEPNLPANWTIGPTMSSGGRTLIRMPPIFSEGEVTLVNKAEIVTLLGLFNERILIPTEVSPEVSIAGKNYRRLIEGQTGEFLLSLTKSEYDNEFEVLRSDISVEKVEYRGREWRGLVHISGAKEFDVCDL